MQRYTKKQQIPADLSAYRVTIAEPGSESTSVVAAASAEEAGEALLGLALDLARAQAARVAEIDPDAWAATVNEDAYRVLEVRKSGARYARLFA